MVRVLRFNYATCSKTVLGKISLLVLGVSKPVLRRLTASAALQNLVINLKTNVGSAFVVFAHSNYHAHASDSTLVTADPVRAFPCDMSACGFGLASSMGQDRALADCCKIQQLFVHVNLGR